MKTTNPEEWQESRGHISWDSLTSSWIAIIGSKRGVETCKYFTAYPDAVKWLRKRPLPNPQIMTIESVGMPDISRYATQNGIYWTAREVL